MSSRYAGFLAMVLGALLVVFSAALPVSVDRLDPGALDVRFRIDGCGPAIAALGHDDPRCREGARRRLKVTTTAGLAAVAVGAAMFAGEGSRRSRVTAPTGRTRRPTRARR